MISRLMEYLVFPGFLFLAASGMAASWYDRKLTARLQWRVGPPFLQPLFDILKLAGKETITPEGANTAVFIAAPFVALSAVIAAAVVITAPVLGKSSGSADVIIALYLFAIPPLAAMMGGAASRNPLAALGTAREMKLILAYELPFVLSMLVPVIQSGSLSLKGFHAAGPAEAHLSGILALVVAFACALAKMGFAPFDFSEAETELAGGTLIEYSGILLSVFKLVRMMLAVLVPLFIAAIFLPWGGLAGELVTAVIILTAAVIVKAATPRLRVDQALHVFWKGLAPVAAIALILAVAGY